MKTLSFIVAALIIAVNIWLGVFDFRAITTDEISTQAEIFVGKTVTLSAITVIEWATEEADGGVLLGARIQNGRIAQPDSSHPLRSILVIGKFHKNSEFLRNLRNGLKHFPQASVSIKNDIYLFESEPADIFSQSWLSAPYQGALMISNRFFGLGTSLVIAAVVQVIVLSVILVLVAAGVFIVVPDVFG